MFCRACGAEISDRSGPVCPQCGQHPGTPDLNTPDNMMVDPQSRTAPSFERTGEIGYMAAWWATVKEVLTDPLGTFSRMRREGLESVTIFVAINGLIMGLFQLVYGLFALGLVYLLINSTGMPGNAASAGKMELYVQIGFTVLSPLSTPILQIIGLYIGGSLIHLALMAVGGAHQPWETTIRGLGYASAANLIFAAMPPIPCLNIIVGLGAFAYLIVLQVLALHELHQNEWWQSIVGLILPIVVGVLLCFGGAALMAVLMAHLQMGP